MVFKSMKLQVSSPILFFFKYAKIIIIIIVVFSIATTHV